MAEAAKELANLYWELVYTELSHESLKADFLKEVKKYVKIAKEYYISLRGRLEIEIDKLDSELQNIEDEENQKKLELHSKDLKDRLLKNHDIITRLYVLMGKVYMNEKDYENASTEFTIAQELHEDKSSFILPYLAEIQFLLGNYTAVNSIINKSADLSLNATLHPIIEQWKSS
jgi:lipopolysaccharide biosynthesis regulator YciM